MRYQPQIARIIAIALVLLGAGAAARAQGHVSRNPERVFLRLMHKGNRATYAGTQTIEIHVRGRRADSTAYVSHMNQTTRTRILTPARLKGMLILERGGRRLVQRPGSDRWQSSPGSGTPQPGKLLANYTLSDEGGVVVAGRAATLLEVRSRSGGKLARKIWLDRETGVVLRAEMYNWSGQLVYATEFQQIDYTPQLDERDFDVNELLRSRRPQTAGTPPPDLPDVPRPSYVPAGFQPVGRPNGIRTRFGVAAHLRYSDGLNAISVFIRKLQEGENPRSPGMLPPMDQPFSAVVHHIKGSYRVTIIGDVDPSELRRMADSVE